MKDVGGWNPSKLVDFPRTSHCPVLEGKELSFAKHSAVISAFGKYFAKTQIVDAKYHRYLIEAQQARCQADYDTDIEFSEQEVNDYLQQAEEFLSLVSLL